MGNHGSAAETEHIGPCSMAKYDGGFGVMKTEVQLLALVFALSVTANAGIFRDSIGSSVLVSQLLWLCNKPLPNCVAKNKTT